MADEKPGVPDFLPQFLEALRKDGASRETMEQFAQYWRALPPDPTRMPCPFCFASGYNGQLLSSSEKGGSQTVHCRICTKEIVVRQAP